MACVVDNLKIVGRIVPVNEVGDFGVQRSRGFIIWDLERICRITKLRAEKALKFLDLCSSLEDASA